MTFVPIGILTARKRAPADMNFLCQVAFHVLMATPIVSMIGVMLFDPSDMNSLKLASAALLALTMLVVMTAAGALLVVLLVMTIIIECYQPPHRRDVPGLVLLFHQAAFTVMVFRLSGFH